MSPSVSQIEFWLNRASSAKADTTTDSKTSSGYLSYDVFLGLSVLGGFLGLDHLYLRSPLTFLAKLIVNILCFGVWWLYDALQAIFNTDIVKIFGLGVPGLGPQGIASGVLANDVPDKKHMRFFIYAISLIFGGLFGIDSFIVGDKQTGLIRLLSLVSVIFMPIALLWWIYKMFKFFTDTKSVVNENADFFGASEVSFGFGSSIPFLGMLFSPIEMIKRFLNDIAGPVVEPITDTAKMAIETVDKTVNTIGKTIELGKEVVSKGTEIAGEISKTIDTVGKGVGSTLSVIPGASLYSSITPETLQKELSEKKLTGGGGNLNILPYSVLGTILLVAVSGFIATYLRSKKDVTRKQRDDSPPEPGIFRESDSKESFHST
jgi:hypothetical protein